MTTLTIPLDLAERLYRAARRQGRSVEDCALAAILSYVEDCEDSARQARQLNGDDSVYRPPEGFYD